MRRQASASADDAHALVVQEVATMLRNWEDSGELYTEFAHRIVSYVERMALCTSSASANT